MRVEARIGADKMKRAAALHSTSQGNAHRVGADVIMLHQCVMPNMQLTPGLRAEHRLYNAQLCFGPKVDACGELDVTELFKHHLHAPSMASARDANRRRIGVHQRLVNQVNHWNNFNHEAFQSTQWLPLEVGPSLKRDRIV
ncbi:hypothetical protein QF025_006735 [Paraburkholderia graminis]|uniref:Uncharacterized protein n=1 Tax=Paraburkholderia graminis TaxID=60548 RepID=A0ABD5CS01_9BURK|nr:hypothetical protein [Paraburkholderia graminis]